MCGLVSSFLTAPIIIAFGAAKVPLLDMKAETISLLLLLDAAITFLLLAVILKVRREPLASLGLPWERWKRDTLVGLALVPFLLLINALVSIVFKAYFPEYYTERNPLTEIIRTPQQLALFILAALIAGGVKEELQRAFILDRFRRYLGGAVVGLLIWSVLFGASHYVQGAQGVAVASVFGLILGILYLSRGSLIAPVAAHGVYDAAALLLSWFFK